MTAAAGPVEQPVAERVPPWPVERVPLSSAEGVPPALVEAVQRRLVDWGLPPDPTNVARAIRAESVGVIGDIPMVDLIRHLQQELAGFGPLTELLADPATSDVVVNGPDDVRVDRGDGWQRAPVRFSDEASVQRLARRLAVTAGARLDDAHPFVDGSLPGGIRLHAVLPPLAVDGVCLSLRVLRPRRFDLAALDAAGLCPGYVRSVLDGMIATRLSFLICGGTGSGKTTLLSALIGEMDAGQRIVTIEDAAELMPTHPHVLRLVARPANVEGAGAIGMAELVRQALRMRPDRLVVGEVRGAEVVDLLAALGTGHEGSAGTVHANGAAEVPARIAALAAMAGVPRAAAMAGLASAVQIVIHLRRDDDGRRVDEIAVLSDGVGAALTAVPALVEGVPTPDGGPLLQRILAARGVAAPW